MASTINSTFSLLFTTAAILLLAASPSEAKFKRINPWCKTADHRHLCTQMVGNSTSQTEAIVRAVEATIKATEKVMPGKNSVLGKDAGPVVQDKVVGRCRECFETALDNLREATSFVHADDMPTVLDRIQTAGSSYIDCGDAMKESVNEVAGLAKVTRILFRFASNCMAVATQM